MADSLEVFNSAHTGAAIDAAVSAVKQKESKWDAKQDKLTGKQGQIVGFGADGNAKAEDAPFLPSTGGTVTGQLTISESGDFPITFYGNGFLEFGKLGFVSLEESLIDFEKFRDVAVPTPAAEYDAANKGYVDGLAAHQATVTLTVAGWASKAQTVSVSGILKDQTKQVVDVAPADTASRDAWVKAGIWCTDPTADGQLTFTCDTVPTVAVNVRVRWQGVVV